MAVVLLMCQGNILQNKEKQTKQNLTVACWKYFLSNCAIHGKIGIADYMEIGKYKGKMLSVE